MRSKLLLLILALMWLSAGTAAALEVLRVSAIPDEAPTELIRKFTPLVKYLEAKLGLRVRFIPIIDYAATVEALAAKKLDMVWFGGFTHVQARRRTGNAQALVMRREDLKFHSKFIVRKGSGIKRLTDLKNKTFAFGSVSSTSGHLMPRYFLIQAGIIPERDFRRFSYSGAHDATAKWVEAGKVDAGALNEAVWAKLVEEGRVDLNRVEVLWTTPPYVDYNWTVRGDLDEGLKERIVEAFISLDYGNPAHRVIMELQRTRGYVKAKAEYFIAIEEAARAAGMFK